MNGSGLHSHTTAEVFIIHSGAWRFYWGVDGTEGEVLHPHKTIFILELAKLIKSLMVKLYTHMF